ncbi:MAG: hypothetical protein R3A11_06775 [Bdellovibrionota bacterium]
MNDMLWESRTNQESFGNGRFSYSNASAEVIYTAANPFSAKVYGDTLLSIEFCSEAVILDLNFDSGASLLQTAIRDDLGSQQELWESDCDSTKVIFLVLEELGVDLIQYRSSSDWFQVLRTEKIREINLQDMSTVTSSTQDIIDAFHALGRRAEADLEFLMDRNVNDFAPTTWFQEFRGFVSVR